MNLPKPQKLKTIRHLVQSYFTVNRDSDNQTIFRSKKLLKTEQELPPDIAQGEVSLWNTARGDYEIDLTLKSGLVEPSFKKTTLDADRETIRAVNQIVGRARGDFYLPVVKRNLTALLQIIAMSLELLKEPKASGFIENAITEIEKSKQISLAISEDFSFPHRVRKK